MIAENSIREKLSRFLRNDISLDQFEDWLAQSSWNMHVDSDPSARKLASSIELRLAEHSSGHLDERALRDELRVFVTSSRTPIWFGEIPAVQISQQPANNFTVEGLVQALQVAIQDPATAHQEVAGVFDTALATANA